MQLDELKSKLEQGLIKAYDKKDRKNLELLLKAYNFAFQKHLEQRRKSGEAYIVHPVAVARTLIELNADIVTICAGLLHDTLEDTCATEEEIKNIFGEDIFNLVDGVTKLGKLTFKSSAEEQADNFRKMLMAIANDVRVVLVKLADRLNNMQTLNHLSPEKQQKISRETLDIFAPLANRFGLHAIKTELEDLCFKFLWPEEFDKVKKIVSSKKIEREAQVKIVQEKIREILLTNNIRAEIQGRAKHFYSIYRKLKDPNTKEIDTNIDHQIYDLLGIRILVDDVKDCYASLGLVHEKFRPMAGRFKDYIALPKTNLYQSLHTTVLTPYGKPLEVQIRTYAMHDIAENGIAAHWNYKETESSDAASAKDLEELSWIRQLISCQTDVDNAQEYLDIVKKDILSQEVYILTPKGDVFTLPVDSTPIDFAYKIHSKIGDTCTGAKVNDKIVPINYKLQNGDLVEIITSKNSHPNLTWLNFVKTNQAKHRIKSWYKKQNHDRHLILGKQLLEEKYGKDGLDNFVKSKELEEVSHKLNYKNTEDLIASIGAGDTTLAQIQGKLQGTKYAESKTDLPILKKIRKSPLKGEEADIPDLDGLLYNIAKCCMPIPGEPVLGVVSKGKGITVHRNLCENLKQVDKSRLMQVDWGPKAEKYYPTFLTVEVVDRVGAAKDILTLVADAGINVSDVKVRDRPSENTAIIRMILNVIDRDQLQKIITALKSMSDVLTISRQ